MRISDWSSDVCSSDLLTVNIGNLYVNNPDGYDGDPEIGLAPTITTDHSWDGDHIFTGDVDFLNGLSGDLEGNVTGNLTGNVTGNVTGNLTGNAAGNHTGTFKGDVDVSEGTLTLAPGQINLAALNQDVINYIILNSKSEEHTSELQSLMRISYAVF